MQYPCHPSPIFRLELLWLEALKHNLTTLHLASCRPDSLICLASQRTCDAASEAARQVLQMWATSLRVLLGVPLSQPGSLIYVCQCSYQTEHAYLTALHNTHNFKSKIPRGHPAVPARYVLAGTMQGLRLAATLLARLDEPSS